MTVSSTTNRSGPYAGNGVTTNFEYQFRILDAAHVSVILTEDGVDTVVDPSDYTVTGVGSADGGDVVFAVAPATGQAITLIRNAAFTQEVDLENQGAFFAEVIEEALDLAAMRDQQLQEQINRAVRIPVGADASTLDSLISDVIRLSGSADEIDAVAGISDDVTTVAGLTSEISALPGQLSAAQTAASDAETTLADFETKYLGAKPLAPSLDNEGNSLIVGATYWDIGSEQMFTWSGTEWTPTFLTGNVVRNLTTATAGQTAVTVPTYIVGANTLSVFLNGLRVIVGDDYVETDQNTITFTSGLTDGDEIEAIVLQPYAIGTTGAESITTTYGVTLARLLELKQGTVADLLADTTLNPASLPVGSVIEAGGFRYEVAASSATDHDLTTAGGVKLYVLNKGNTLPAAFGITGDVLIPTHFATLQEAIDALGPNQPEPVNLLIEAGHQPASGVSVSNADYGNYSISSVDAEVTVGAGYTGIWLFCANARAPVLNCLVNANGIGSHGCWYEKASTSVVNSGCGVRNVGGNRALYANNSVVTANGSIFTGSAGRGFWIAWASVARLDGADFSDCAGFGGVSNWVSRNAHVTAVAATINNSAGDAVSLNRGSSFVAHEIVISGATGGAVSGNRDCKCVINDAVLTGPFGSDVISFLGGSVWARGATVDLDVVTPSTTIDAFSVSAGAVLDAEGCTITGFRNAFLVQRGAAVTGSADVLNCRTAVSALYGGYFEARFGSLSATTRVINCFQDGRVSLADLTVSGGGTDRVYSAVNSSRIACTNVNTVASSGLTIIANIDRGSELRLFGGTHTYDSGAVINCARGSTLHLHDSGIPASVVTGMINDTLSGRGIMFGAA